MCGRADSESVKPMRNNSTGKQKEAEQKWEEIQERIKEDITAGRCEIFFRVSDYDPELKKQKEEFMKRLLSQS